MLSVAKFRTRVAGHLLLALATVVFGLGVLGYYYLGSSSWVDSLLNASMIFGGMGPVDPLQTDAAKVSASFCALFSGLIFIGGSTLMIAPFAHRLLHKFHLDETA